VGEIDPAQRPHRLLDPSGTFYDHRLIMVTVNDYSLGLFNGDVGVVLAEAGSGALYAWFERQAAAGGDPYRRIPVNMLPDNETAFATTVHKSQGSEFERVLLVLPPDEHSPVMTRELLYTGLTRTKGPLDLWCTEAAFTACVARPTCRASGLKDRLATSEELHALPPTRPNEGCNCES
jgi:exodeoxyribonuclease V alpha subunit